MYSSCLRWSFYSCIVLLQHPDGAIKLLTLCTRYRIDEVRWEECFVIASFTFFKVVVNKKINDCDQYEIGYWLQMNKSQLMSLRFDINNPIYCERRAFTAFDLNKLNDIHLSIAPSFSLLCEFCPPCC